MVDSKDTSSAISHCEKLAGSWAQLTKGRHNERHDIFRITSAYGVLPPHFFLLLKDALHSEALKYAHGVCES